MLSIGHESIIADHSEARDCRTALRNGREAPSGCRAEPEGIATLLELPLHSFSAVLAGYHQSESASDREYRAETPGLHPINRAWRTSLRVQ